MLIEIGKVFVKVFVFVVVVLYLSSGVLSLVCSCTSCVSCTAQLNNVSCSQVNLVSDISGVAGTCVDNPSNFSDKVFDCQGYWINGTNVSGSSAVLVSGDGVTVRNCWIRNFTYGIRDPSDITGILITDTTSTPHRWGFQNGSGYIMNYSSNNGNFTVNNSGSLNLTGDIIMKNTSTMYCDNFAPAPGSEIRIYDANGVLRQHITLNTTKLYDANGDLIVILGDPDRNYRNTWGGNPGAIVNRENMYNYNQSGRAEHYIRQLSSAYDSWAASTLLNDVDGYEVSLILASSNYTWSGDGLKNAGGIAYRTPGIIGSVSNYNTTYVLRMWNGTGESFFNHIVLYNVSVLDFNINVPTTNITDGSLFVSGNVSAQSGFMNLNWSYLQNAPNFSDLYVPYVSAVKDVDLGNYTLTAQKLYVNSDNIPITSKLVSGTLVAGQKTNIYTDVDLSGYYNASYTAFEGCVMGSKNNTELTFAKLNTQFDNIIVVGVVGVVGVAWYDNTTATINATGAFTSEYNNIELFHKNAAVVYIGNDDNFTEVGVSLAVGASKNIEATFHYCNSSGGWEEFSVTDTTLGFRQSGTISFINPSDRGVCNKELDGTPFSDTSNYTYLAVKRTLDDGKLATKPVENIISVSGGGEQSMVMTKDLLMLSPVSTPPEICTSSWLGAMYNDNDINLPCYCNGVNWVQMDDFSSICS